MIHVRSGTRASRQHSKGFTLAEVVIFVGLAALTLTGAIYGYAVASDQTPCSPAAQSLPVPGAEQALTAAERAAEQVLSFITRNFYSIDLEINPGAQMKVTGKVHNDADRYCAPRVGLEFHHTVGCVAHCHDTRDPNDPQFGSAKVEPVFDNTNSQTCFSRA